MHLVLPIRQQDSRLFHDHYKKHQVALNTTLSVVTLFEPKFDLGRTKTECIITNVFAKESKSRLNAALQNAVYFIIYNF